MPQISANGARFFYRLEGDPSCVPVVLVHPIGADHGLWDKVAPLITQWAYVLRYDLRGHGGSETTAGDYSLQLMSGDLLALTAAVGVERFCAVGVSLGGLTVLDAAARAPERMHRLCVCSAAARMAPPPGGWDVRARSVRQEGTRPLAASMVERMFSESFRASRDPAIETMRSTLLRMDREGYASACAVLRDADLTAVLGKIAQRSLIVSGEHDVLTPPAAARAIADGLPHARHVTLPCGHFPPLEAAEEFALRLRAAFAPESN